ncbi:hypothetical protein KR054_005962, partial [Drosophila jambulina]
EMVRKQYCVKFAITVAVVAVCITIMTLSAGFKHEDLKFKTMLFSMLIVLFFQYLIGDPIRFVLFSFDRATWPPPIFIPPPMKKPDTINRVDFLKKRLVSQRSNLILSSRYRNYALNEKYKLIAQDLLIYGPYYLCLMIMVLMSRDEMQYHNTRAIQALFWNNHTDYYGLKEVHFLTQLFNFIESTLVVAFNANSSHYLVPGWVHAEGTVMLGVIRLRQLRLLDPDMGWAGPVFSEMHYFPKWELPYRRLYYADKYWRTYEPWVPFTVSNEFLESLLMNFDHVGYLNRYPEGVGYVSLLARSVPNNMKIIDFLIENHWLTLNTSAVFLDFTLYNVDVNLFTICTLRVEQTPFGTVVPHMDVDSFKLLEEMDQRSYTRLAGTLVYAVVLIQFAQMLVLKMWYEPKLLKNVWNMLDLIIIALNVIVIVMVLTGEWLVNQMMKKVAESSKMDFIDFRLASRLHQLSVIMIGFLICTTTLRLWRVLQFSSVFKLFTRSLYLAGMGMISTAMVILVFLLGYCFAVVTINGNNSENFLGVAKAIVMCMCFAFGFSNQVKPSELFHGGEVLGIILYAILAFVVAVLMINVFASMINHFFIMSKARRDAKPEHSINFFQFLRVAYPKWFNWVRWLPCFRGRYVRNKRTVAQNVNVKLDVLEAKREMQMRKFWGNPNKIDEEPEEFGDIMYRDRGEKLIKVGKLLSDQLALLEILLFQNAEDDLLWDEDFQVEVEEPKRKRKLWCRSKSKVKQTNEAEV